jgi:hypothetical protein
VLPITVKMIKPTGVALANNPQRLRFCFADIFLDR